MRQIAVLAAITIITAVTCAKTITVALDDTGDYTTIQAAVNAAQNDDTIVVADGTYDGVDYFPGDVFDPVHLIIRSRNGPENCIIDCKGDRAFAFHKCERHIIDGFTIINGAAGYVSKMPNWPDRHSYDVLYGGAILCDYYDNGIDKCRAYPTIRNCIFINNTAGHGGAIASLKWTWGNVTIGGGGFIENCLFIGNYSCPHVEKESRLINDPDTGDFYFESYEYPMPGDGGAVYGNFTMVNCVVVDTSGNGSAVVVNDVTNSIIWNNSTDTSVSGTVKYSCIQGGPTGNGNINIDPLFADPDNGDFHLKSEYGRWNSASQQWVYDDVTSPCIDAGDPASQWQNELYPHGRRSNMGACANTPQASMSPSTAGNIADFNHDDKVTIQDFAALANKWQLAQLLLAEDLNRNGKVDLQDLKILAQNWLNN